ncbi:DEAD/DEAH box helicase [Taibaiella chishuiensis]|uniref:Superfamily II DNA/RNA helicase n=1 Tax=Taibaiella chishuiensis TaxID=1434707 RepID=A0A2P8DAT2_9BACT|nr:DEAD/DEAH box helicase [Taibaiella chishuiensis]PSK94301.1 superfamily II DNA/RNA helicase [Taibaiella chishuiensis]
MQTKNYTVEQILANLNIEALNEMQQASVAANEQHNDVMLLSATGSGKTLAFLLPMLSRLDPESRDSQALIIVPSRELAMQIEKVFKQMGTGFKITCCYGGHKREIEENNLIQPPAVIVGTPGRLADHIRRGNIKTGHIRTLVLDEFDKSLELGFTGEVSEIIEALPALEKRILTSATEAVEVPEFVGLQSVAELNFLDEANESDNGLAIKKVLSGNKDKLDTLFQLICYLGNRSTIVFCNHRESVERTHELLRAKGILSEFYHGAMEQRDRDSALCKFRNGTSNLLVTTDLAARGLDIPNIRYIIHYHLPLGEDVYTHRNGRTARMDASGTAILILSAEERLPAYITEPVEEIKLEGPYEIPEKPKWSTLYIPLGKKNKVNKIDIVGFLSAKGELKQEDIGLIEVKDFFSFVAVRKTKVSHMLQLVKEERIKGKKVKIEVAK